MSSIDGLNIFDGLHVRVYRPGTDNMFDENVQSGFFEDTLGRIWFTTYGALHYYDPVLDSISFVHMPVEGGGSYTDNYKACYLDEAELYLKAGTGFFVYNIYKKQVERRIPLRVVSMTYLAMIKRPWGKALFVASPDTLRAYRLDTTGGFQLMMDQAKRITALYGSDHGMWVGCRSGEMIIYHDSTFQPQYTFTIHGPGISDIAPYRSNGYLVSNNSTLLYLVDPVSREIVDTMTVRETDGSNTAISGITGIYQDQDSTLWMSSSGKGVFFQKLTKRKFKLNLEGRNITRLFPFQDDQFIVFTRHGNGIFQIDEHGHILNHWPQLPDKPNLGITAVSGAWLDAHRLLFQSIGKMYVLNVESGKIQLLYAGNETDIIFFEQIDRLANGRVIGSTGSEHIFNIEVEGNQLILTPYSNIRSYGRESLNFREDTRGNLWVSNDEISIIVMKPELITKSHAYMATVELRGGVRDLLDIPDSSFIYLANTTGLYKIDKNTYKHTRIIDEDQVLAQTIYSIRQDDKGYLWMGTNTGIVQYDPQTKMAHPFTLQDGIQELEFNSRVSAVLSDGRMFFGGVNGYNDFYPNEIHLDQRKPAVYISSVSINDVAHPLYTVADQVREYVLPYGENTISFRFHAIDYSDPTMTRVRYKLSGVDDDYLETDEANGFIRYAKLSPGKYTFSLLGRNADGVWSALPREISILIKPPFWRTWWFIGLMLALVGSIVYVAIREVYRRKLRQQMIIIEKQQAVEQERTRIAAEMHDDLGAGLTTIRYLSDKALQQAQNREEAAQIKRIAEQSNALVRNMSEIIWAMNSRFDTAESLIAYLRRYAVEYLQEHNLPVEFNSHDTEDKAIAITGEKRRNIFLVMKELLHNTVKYSGAGSVYIDISTNGAFSLTLREIGGKGFDPITERDHGNGIYNAERRMQTINGSITYTKLPESMDITLTMPLAQ